MSRTRGQLAIVLHTHMPFVIGHGVWPFGEEWLWRAVGESYLRVADAVRGNPVTIGVTPVLADQFEAMRGEAGDRMLGWINDSREYVYGEDMGAFHQVGRGDLHEALEPQLADYRRAAALFEGEFARDINGVFDDLAGSGVELLGGPATHAVLPLVATDFGADLQLRTGLRSHRARFGEARGIWLPECAVGDGVDQALARNAVEYFCVDRSRELGLDAPGNLEPVRTAAGPVAVPIDWKTIELAWHEHGYPAAGAYRSSFARTIHALLPYNNDGDAWNPEAARAQAHAHAAAFLRSVAARLEVYETERGEPGLCTFAIDTELLGHWWYEGPWWLAEVIAEAEAAGIELVTLGQAVGDSDPQPADLPRSSWGEGKTLDTWDSPPVAAFAWQQRAAELEFADALGHGGAEAPAALRAARELLALQASDWAFLAKRGTAGEYPIDRFAGHLAGFEGAIDSVRQSSVPNGDAGHITTVNGLAPLLTNETLEELC